MRVSVIITCQSMVIKKSQCCGKTRYLSSAFIRIAQGVGVPISLQAHSSVSTGVNKLCKYVP